MTGAAEQDYRQALMLAERALMHAAKCVPATQPAVTALVIEARMEVSRVLDIGRDEANEMTLT